MRGSDPKIEAALHVLGLRSPATLSEAKGAFRQLAKALHPDRTPPTTATLARLSAAIAAIRIIEKAQPTEIILTISAADAKNGAHRSWSGKGRSGVFHIPGGIECGTLISAVGDSGLTARIRVENTSMNPIDKAQGGNLERFIADFALDTPASRFANWLRQARNAA